MSIINYLYNNFFFFLNFYEEFLIVLFIYNFIKLIIFSSILELLWPTHFFNKRNNFSNNNIKLRNLYESILKIKKINNKFNVFNKKLIKNLL